MSEDPKWTGEERRSIPIQIINYIDSRLAEYSDQFNGKLDSLQQEIYCLKQSLDSWMEKTPPKMVEQCEKIVDEAIPSHPDNPTATPAEKRKEHRKAHASWIKRVDDEMEEWRQLRKSVKEWAIKGVLLIVVVAVWQYLLNGPK